MATLAFRNSAMKAIADMIEEAEQAERDDNPVLLQFLRVARPVLENAIQQDLAGLQAEIRQLEREVNRLRRRLAHWERA